jgi:hypothetical protein
MRLATWLVLAALVSAQAPGSPRPEVVKQICAGEFGQGEMARVDVLHDKAGVVKVLRLQPDIRRFSHAPHTYYGPDGATLLVVPERPITPEEAKTDPVLVKLEALTRDLKPGRPVSCSAYR